MAKTQLKQFGGFTVEDFAQHPVSVASHSVNECEPFASINLDPRFTEYLRVRVHCLGDFNFTEALRQASRAADRRAGRVS